MLLTLELDETIRTCEIAGIRNGIETVQRLYPEAGAASIEIAGGLVAFTGTDSPLTQAYGVGAGIAVSSDDIARITEFYETRNVAARVFVTPLADSSLSRGLAAAGYAPAEYDNVLACESFDSAASDDRIGVSPDSQAWARASASGFTGRTELTHEDFAIARILAFSKGVIALEAREGGEIVATSAMDLFGGCAGLFAGSTMPDFRNRGWHTAMIRDRIARARDGGARFMRATARPASASERNFVRCGFAPLYTRVLWERARRDANA